MTNLSRGWTALIVASLSMNLFVLGFVAANGVRAAQAPAAALVRTLPEPGRVPAPPLPPPERIVQINTKDVRPSQMAVRKANEEVTAALRAEPYDAQRLAKALDNLRVAAANSQHAVHSAMLVAVNGMSAEQRARFAEASKGMPAERVLLRGR
jgi:uncharacterized membrane protein